ncbi:MAG: 50S ribosomal protein L4 [Calditrichaeota bacterium]|nr:MAG: 50S ribosomal protein L4 [Calditrichota bacterium]MBL1205023.1 50S ribosomal protein L4 [Calditrichota bacterium]NOG44853.1 50S ribosomal protein L4 [Calditrichota bacterium]
MNLEIYSQKGKKTAKKAELKDSVFACEINEHVVWLDVKNILANKRQGTHQSKGRSYVSGGGRKPFKQKGTGRARQGSTRAPHHVGGGRVFGPSPRDYNSKINKKTKLLARKSVLTDKVNNKQIYVVEDFNFDQPKTKEFLQFISALEVDAKKVLVLTNGYAPQIYKSAANLYQIDVKQDVTFSTYDLLKANTVIIQEGALKKINEVLG